MLTGAYTFNLRNSASKHKISRPGLPDWAILPAQSGLGLGVDRAGNLAQSGNPALVKQGLPDLGQITRPVWGRVRVRTGGQYKPIWQPRPARQALRPCATSDIIR